MEKNNRFKSWLKAKIPAAKDRAGALLKKTSPTYMILFVFLVVYTVTLLIPLLWTTLTAFKDPDYYSQSVLAEDASGLINFKNLTLDNFKTAFRSFTVPATGKDGKTLNYNILGLFVNSLLYSVGCAVCATAVPCVVSYLCARFKYKFGKVVYGVVLVAMALPIVGSLPSEIKMVTSLHMFDTVWGMYILKCNFLGLYFLLLHAQFKTISMEYTEAARVDGASELRIMLQVIFPMAVSTILSVFILNFVSFWNDYQIPMIYWPSRPVAAYGMWVFNRSTIGFTARTPNKLAGILLMALPILIIYAFFNKRLATNVSVGGIKG